MFCIFAKLNVIRVALECSIFNALTFQCIEKFVRGEREDSQHSPYIVYRWNLVGLED
jgi:hypothetical protein